MVTDVWEFLVGVVGQWQALVTGSLLTAILFAVERSLNKQLSRRSVVPERVNRRETPRVEV
jgi:hypothetical protein